MPNMQIVDFNDPPFDPGNWYVTTFWGDSSITGLRSNAISHNQSTAFSFTERLSYIKVIYEISSETNYDKMRIDIDGVSKFDQGTSSGTFEYTFETEGEHTITFTYHKDGSNSSGQDAAFLKEISYQLQYEVRYLIQGPDNTLYTFTDGTLTQLADQSLTGENFLSNGLLEPPSGTWITDLPNAKVLYWQDTLSDTVPKVTAALNANPPNQIVLTWEADMNHESILGINRMAADVDGYVSITLTFDHNTTWWKFDGTNWVQTTQNNGMTKEVLNAVTVEQWAALLELVEGSLVYRVSLVLDETSILKRFDVDYINP